MLKSSRISVSGMLSSCAILVSMGYTRDPYLTVILLIASVALQGTIGPGIGVNHVDISPKYAGVLMGISNMVSTLSGILSPLVVGLVTSHEVKATIYHELSHFIV